MAMNFGKLNFAVGFNRTSAFPLDANSYFEDYNEAVAAAADEGCYGRGGAMVIMMQTMLGHTLCREITHGKVKIIDKIGTFVLLRAILFVLNAIQSF